MRAFASYRRYVQNSFRKDVKWGEGIDCAGNIVKRFDGSVGIKERGGLLLKLESLWLWADKLKIFIARSMPHMIVDFNTF